MTRLTRTDARDLMVGHATSSIPINMPVAYEDKPFNSPATGPWARITARTAGRHQRAMGDGKKKYITFGVICIEYFTAPGDGLTASDTYADASVVYLESMVSSPIVYRNIRAVDIGQDGGYTKVNVYADFEYEDHH